MRSCRLMIDDEITDSINSRWAASDKHRVALDRMRFARLLNLQRGVLSVIIGIVTCYYSMGVHVKCISVRHIANDFCISWRGEEEEDAFLQLLETNRALCQRRKWHLGAYFIADMSDLSHIDIILSSKRFQTWGIVITNCATWGLSASIQFIWGDRHLYLPIYLVKQKKKSTRTL